MGEQLMDSAKIMAALDKTSRLMDAMTEDLAGFRSTLGQLSESLGHARVFAESLESKFAELPQVHDEPKPRIMLLFADLTDPETGDVMDTRVAVFSNDWIIAESSDGDQEFGRLSMEAVEVMAYNLSKSLGVEQIEKRVTMVDDFPQGSFEWDLALDALHDQEGKQNAPKMGM
jgi:hypothetical protein